MRIGLCTVGSDIVFHRDERWVEKDQMMVFTAESNGRRTHVSLSENVLKVHFLSERLGRFQAFRENRQQIEEVAAAQFHRAAREVLHLDLDDFTEAADFIPWER